MTLGRKFIHPFQALSDWLGNAQLRIQEWVRNEIIDFDPYEIEVCWDGEFLMVESGRILDISDLDEFNLDEFMQYLVAERLPSSAPVEDGVLRPFASESAALSSLLKEEFAHASQPVCAQVSLYSAS